MGHWKMRRAAPCCNPFADRRSSGWLLLTPLACILPPAAAQQGAFPTKTIRIVA